MKTLTITATPNQSFSARLDNSLFDIAIKTINDTACIDVSRDGVALIKGARITPGTPIFPYSYLETGNFLFTTLNDDLPDYTKFGISQNIYYITAAELEAIYASAA